MQLSHIWLLICLFVTQQLCSRETNCFQSDIIGKSVSNSNSATGITTFDAPNQQNTTIEGQDQELLSDEAEEELEDEIAQANYGGAEEHHNRGPRLKLDSHTISRLRNMIHESHKQATDHAREMGLIKGMKGIKEHFKEEKKRMKKEKDKGKGKAGGGGYDYPYYPVGQPPYPYPPDSPLPSNYPPNYYAPSGPYGYDEYNYFGRGPADSYANEDKKKGIHGFDFGKFSKKDKEKQGQPNMYLSRVYPPSADQLYNNYPWRPYYDGSHSEGAYPSSSYSAGSFTSGSIQGGSPQPSPSPPPPQYAPPPPTPGATPGKTNPDGQQQQELQTPSGVISSGAQGIPTFVNNIGKTESGAKGQSQVPEGMPARELLHSDARQASIFSGLHMPGSSPFLLGQQNLFQQNPLAANNLFQQPKLPNLATFPTLPKMPTLPPLLSLPTVSMKPPPKPKMSVIGNDGGPMSLSNDNVVVVNVLSNNW